MKETQENKVLNDPLHKKYGQINILGHMQNRDLLMLLSQHTWELCHRLRWDEIQCNSCTTCSKGLLLGI